MVGQPPGRAPIAAMTTRKRQPHGCRDDAAFGMSVSVVERTKTAAEDEDEDVLFPSPPPDAGTPRSVSIKLHVCVCVYLLKCIYVCMYGHTYSKSMDQPGKVANPALGQLNREN